MTILLVDEQLVTNNGGGVTTGEAPTGRWHARHGVLARQSITGTNQSVRKLAPLA